MGWRGRASMGHDGAISVITRTRVRYGRQRPLGRSKTC
jgi:hypothetical protein